MLDLEIFWNKLGVKKGKPGLFFRKARKRVGEIEICPGQKRFGYDVLCFRMILRFYQKIFLRSI